MMSSLSSFLITVRRTAINSTRLTVRQLHTSMPLMMKRQDSGLLEQLYSKKEAEKILDLLNNKPLEDMARSKLGTAKLRQHIVDSRPFHDLQDILKLPTLDIVRAEKLCKVLLRSGVQTRQAQSQPGVCHPMITTSQASSLKTVTALRLGSEYSSWLTMTDELEFQQAGTHEMLSDGRQIQLYKYDHVVYLEAVKSFAKRLPPSDAYLLPRHHFNLKGKTAFYVAVQGGMNLLNATFSTLISVGSSQSSVHFINSMHIASLFNIKVGGEMVNIEEKVDQLIASGLWKDHRLTGLDTLQRQRQAVRTQNVKGYDPYSSLLLNCTGFITDVLYKAR